MSDLLQDLRFSLRILARNPGFAAVAILTLAITLGANTAVFSLLDGILLRALPYPEPDQIMDVAMLSPLREGRPEHKEYLDDESFQALRQRARTVEQLAAYRTGLFTLTTRGPAERLPGARVSPALFPLLRVPPVLGRSFREEEERGGGERVVLLSDRLWHRRFAGDPAIVGKALRLDGSPYTVVGVMPRSFSFPNRDVELWVPLAAGGMGAQTASVLATQYFPVIARLRPGVAAQQAEIELSAVLHRLRPTPHQEKVLLSPLRDQLVTGVRPALLALSAAVGLVLLIACINLAALLLVQGSAREREMALRSAVGGSRGRLLRQALTESAVLSFAGGATGLLVAAWVHLLLPRILPQDLPRLEEIRFDARVFLFALLLSGVTGLAFGLIPALRSSGGDVIRSLYGGSEAAPGRPTQSLFAVLQIALAFFLLVTAGSGFKSFLHLVTIDLGYEPDHLLTATLDLDGTRHALPRQSEALFDEILERLQRNPDVKAAGVVSFPPLSPSFSLTSLEIPEQPSARVMAVPQLSSPGYLKAVGLQLSRGRWLSGEDLATRAPVAIVNESFVRHYLLGQGDLGRRIQAGKVSLRIVGVVADVRLLGPSSAPKPELFTSYHNALSVSGEGPRRLTLAMRTIGDPAALLPSLRRLVLDLDPGLALEEAQPMRARLAASLARPRLYTLLLELFACMALVLAAAGIYGTLSSTVNRQTRAIGVRRALGAEQRDILGMVLKKGLFLVSSGLALGIAAAAGASKALERLLTAGVSIHDPFAYSVALLTLVGVAFIACYLPARRATRIDPGDALRSER
jgi:putative ABC transport system permease protein